MVLAIVLLVVSVTTSCGALELEAEGGASYPTGAQRPRSAASNDATVLLHQGQSVTLHFSVFSSCSVSVTNVAYTNDGGSDTISVAIDETSIGSFQTVGESNFGHNWNVVRDSGGVGNSVSITSDTHTVRVTATTTDQFGVEIDKVSLSFNDGCITNIQCTDPPTSIPSSGTCVSSDAQGSIVQRSVATSCAEEDNIHVPVYFDHVREFTLTATLPEYASLSSANNRDANFTNCELTSRTIWEIGNEDMTSTEFSTSCSSLPATYRVDTQPRDICGVLNNQDRRQIILTFRANGPSTGQVESTTGSLLTVQFAQVTGNLTVEAAVFGRLNSWVSLGSRGFTSTSKSYTWHTPDLTWEEGNNMVRLTVTAASSSADATSTLDYIKLERREERGEFEIAPEIYNDGTTIVKAIGKDFWWLYPQSMTLRDTRSGSQWSDVIYVRVLRKIPSINSWPEVFVLYQDGNSRILTFPPSGIDWIPFGSSVIVGASDPDSARPYAAISRIDFDPTTLKFTLHFAAGGQAVVNIATNISSTTVTVSNITYATNTSLPFATFRSMWVSDGNADVDHVRSENSTSVRHVVQDGWSRLTGRNFFFFRTCLSQHNTLSPDIRVEVQCVGDDTTPSTTASTTSTSTTSLDLASSNSRSVSTTESSSQDKPTTVAASSDVSVLAQCHSLPLLLISSSLHLVGFILV